MREIELSQGYVATVDEIDFGLNEHKWCCDGYAKRRVDGGIVYLHQLIAERMGLESAIDHRNRCGLDCRRINLRPVTHQQNLMNQTKYKNNTSGIPGVCWYKQKKKWCARIVVDRKHIHLGLFDSLRDHSGKK